MKESRAYPHEWELRRNQGGRENMLALNDTIAAISTAVAPAGIGIVRISGEDAVIVADRVFVPAKSGKKLETEPSHTIHYGWIMDQGEVIDEVLIMLMRGPKTYTGEDTVEIDCHGGVLAVRKVLECVLSHGARCAEPGEFTKRAFLSGRIDLSQAEAVMDVISAKNEYALKSSLTQVKGNVRGKISEIRAGILYELAFIESALDDPEHISLDGYPEQLLAVIEQKLKEVERLIRSSDDGKLIHEGIKTVILGKPNAGKSSLLNVLVGEEKAIVTDIAGTTRDVLEEQIMLNGISLFMLDTAGIRNTEDKVEQIGVQRAMEQAKDADLILYVVDASVPLDENDEKIIDFLAGRKCIILQNKSDLSVVVEQECLTSRIPDAPLLSISAKKNSGIDELNDTIKELFFHGNIEFHDEIYITNARHKQALVSAKDSLLMVKQSILDGMPEDFFSIDLMSAYEALGSIIGESVGEDLVNEIFSKFCTGK